MAVCLNDSRHHQIPLRIDDLYLLIFLKDSGLAVSHISHLRNPAIFNLQISVFIVLRFHCLDISVNNNQHSLTPPFFCPLLLSGDCSRIYPFIPKHSMPRMRAEYEILLCGSIAHIPECLVQLRHGIHRLPVFGQLEIYVCPFHTVILRRGCHGSDAVSHRHIASLGNGNIL